MVKSSDSRDEQTGFKSQFWHLIILNSWIRSLSIGFKSQFPISKVSSNFTYLVRWWLGLDIIKAPATYDNCHYSFSYLGQLSEGGTNDNFEVFIHPLIIY